MMKTDSMLRFNILGPLEVICEDRVCRPSAPKVRSVLALLLARSNYLVAIDSIIEELWGAEPPRSSVTTAQTYIYHLRQRLMSSGVVVDAEDVVVTSAPGYVLRIEEDQIDAIRFQKLSDRGRQLLEAGHSEDAATCLHEALALWRGPALADVPLGRLLEGHSAHLEESHVRTLELRLLADLDRGMHRQLLPELRTLVSQYPLNEWLHARLIEALHRSGRRGEALLAYQSVRKVLDEELGLEPSAELRQLQQDVLTGDMPTVVQRPMLPIAS
jgi:DNA-binding SARP family transcriptional activator